MAEPVPRSLPATDVASALTWHRQVAATVEAAHRAGVLPAELPELRARLSAQATLLTAAVTRIGGPLPTLIPTPAEVAAAGALLGDLSAAAVDSALRTMQSTLAAVDAALAGSDGRTVTAAAVPAPAAPIADPPDPGRAPAGEPAVGPAAGEPGVGGSAAGEPAVGEPADGGAPADGPATAAEAAGAESTVDRLGRYGPGVRNAAIYGAYSAVVIAVQVVLFVLLDETRLPAAAPLCLIVLPALAWVAGWLSIGALFPTTAGQPIDRTPRLGLVVCLLPNALLCAGIAAIFGIEHIG